jgi:hypothetical protein
MADGKLLIFVKSSVHLILAQQHAQGDYEASKNLEPSKILELLERPNRKVQIGLAEMLKGRSTVFKILIFSHLRRRDHGRDECRPGSNCPTSRGSCRNGIGAHSGFNSKGRVI